MALVLALPVSAVGYVIHPRTHELADVIGSMTTPSHAIIGIGWALVILGLPGLYASHAQRSGVLGLTGLVLMMVMAVLHVYVQLYEAGPVPLLSSDPSADRLFVTEGVVRQGMLQGVVRPVSLVAPIVYGAALLRSRVHPRWAGWLVIAFIPAFFAFNGVLGLLPDETQETLLDLGYANVGLGVSYLLLNLGLAAPGLRLWTSPATQWDLGAPPPTTPDATAGVLGGD